MAGTRNARDRRLNEADTCLKRKSLGRSSDEEGKIWCNEENKVEIDHHLNRGNDGNSGHADKRDEGRLDSWYVPGAAASLRRRVWSASLVFTV